MDGVEAFRFAQAHMQSLQSAQFEAGISDALDDVTGVARAERVRLDNAKCKIAHN